MKTSNPKQLNSVIEFQRELIARETTITGRICVGDQTNKRDVRNNRILVKHIIVISYSINKRLVEGKEELSIEEQRSKLDHSWIDYDLITYEDGCSSSSPEGYKVVFEGDVDSYTRTDGSESYGFVKLHKLGSLCLNMSLALYQNRNLTLEKAFQVTSSFIEHLANAMEKNRNQCLIYLNPYLLSILLNEHSELRAKLDRKNEIAPPKRKRKKRKGFNTL